MDDYEFVLLVKSQVFVFRLPPLAGNRGYKAADWNLSKPDWTGKLKLVSVKNQLEIRLEDKATGNVYAKAPIESLNSVDFEAVLDSSHDDGQTAFVGIGFEDRGDSFDLNVAIQDHFKSVKKNEEDKKIDLNAPKVDFSFKEGETITVNLKNKTKLNPNESNEKSPKLSINKSGIVPLLPPPPSSNNRIRFNQESNKKI